MLACILVFALFCGLGFAAGLVKGLAYTDRPKTCAIVEQGGAGIPVCEWGYVPPEGWATK